MVEKQVAELLEEEAADQVNIEDIPITQNLLRKNLNVNQHIMQNIVLMQENIMLLQEDI